jgi:hypothetical protein
MKKMLFLIAMIAVIEGCSSGGSKKPADVNTPNEAGVENANGNIPDTSNAIDLNTHKKDPAGASHDSLK